MLVPPVFGMCRKIVGLVGTWVMVVSPFATIVPQWSVPAWREFARLAA